MKCIHLNRRNVYGDEINYSMSRRQMCLDCGKYLHGRVTGLTKSFYDTEALLTLVYEELEKMVY